MVGRIGGFSSFIKAGTEGVVRRGLSTTANVAKHIGKEIGKNLLSQTAEDVLFERGEKTLQKLQITRDFVSDSSAKISSYSKNLLSSAKENSAPSLSHWRANELQ